MPTWDQRITFTSAAQLASELRKAAEAHHKYELTTGRPDADWAVWYADYIFNRKGE